MFASGPLSFLSSLSLSHAFARSLALALVFIKYIS